MRESIRVVRDGERAYWIDPAIKEAILKKHIGADNEEGI